MIGKYACIELRVDQFAVQLDIEFPITSRNQCYRFQTLLVFISQMIRQTDGLRFELSNRAVCDLDLHDTFLWPVNGFQVVNDSHGSRKITLHVLATPKENASQGQYLLC